MECPVKLAVAATLAGALIAMSPAQAADAPHWQYAGPEGAAHWGKLDESYKTCSLGKHQSPIDIQTKDVKAAGDLAPLDFQYTPGNVEVVNTGHAIQANTESGGGVTIDGKAYKLAQFHFHTPSEEKINGKPAAMVAHLVHKDEQGKLAVVAVLFRVGKENAALKPVLADLPAGHGAKAAVATPFDAGALLPAKRNYYAFTGSLTTPPCSEEVTWRVLKQPVELSKAQLAAVKKLYPMNARPVQPLNGRVVQAG